MFYALSGNSEIDFAWGYGCPLQQETTFEIKWSLNRVFQVLGAILYEFCV